jgi:uncharacterized surface protein with fasciclin (FAS1) repeats
MKKRTIKLGILIAITAGVITSACSNDEWDKHYNNTDVVLIDQSLSEIINNETDLRIFNRLLKISGYDTLLSSSQTFTVWAPLDSDSAWNADYSAYLDESNTSLVIDTVKIKKLIGNHISRFSYPTSGLDSQRLFMLCNKIADFEMINSMAYFGNVALGLDANIPAKNGLLHKIAGYSPYIPGHWEFLMEYPETAHLDSLKSYIQTLIEVDAYGDQVNNLFKNYAKLDNDDSTYTFLALTNTAWSNALTTALKYHKIFKDPTDLSYQHSKKAIFEDLFFSRVADPAGLDSIISVSKTVFKPVDNLFIGATKYSLSNGSIFMTDSLRMKPIESYHKRIKVEAETNIYGRTNATSDFYSRAYNGSLYSISDKRYAFLKYTGTGTSYASINMNIPNVLSGKYKLYVVTVPHAIDNPTLARRVKYKVKLAYRAANGTVRPLTNPNFDSSRRNTPATPTTGYIVSATEVQKTYIYDFEFPFCSMYEKGNPNSLDVTIQIENVATRSDEIAPVNPFTRDLRIDCVIFEPVE